MKKVFMTLAMVAALACAVSCGNNNSKKAEEGEKTECTKCDKCCQNEAEAAQQTVQEVAVDTLKK